MISLSVRMAFLWLAILLIGAAGCAPPEAPKPQGTVIEKTHEPESIETKTTHRKIRKDSSITVPVKMRIVDDEDFILKLRVPPGPDDDEPTLKTIYVSKEIYENTAVNANFLIDTNICEFDDPLEQTEIK